MRKRLLRVVVAVGFLLSSFATCQAAVVSFGAFSGDFVTVGDPGNVADTTGYGAVTDTFQIMKYEVTNSQYAAFLNSVAKTDTYFLYNTNMDSAINGGIARNGSPGAFTYSVKTNMSDKPVNYVRLLDAARYCNWLHNGATSSASTETGAYNLGGVTSGNVLSPISSAKFFIPTENQWHKAAYYRGGSMNAGYWIYATQSDVAPGRVTASATGVGLVGNSGNFANYSGGAVWNGQTSGNVTTVGTNGGPSYYGAFDMNGNVHEWNVFNNSTLTSDQVTRGGSWVGGAGGLRSPSRGFISPDAEYDTVGFRVASLSSSTGGEVPEPTSMAIFGLGALGIAYRARRRM